MIFFATAPLHQTDLVEKEVLYAGGKNLKFTQGGIEFDGTLENAYRFALWTRCSTRLLMLIQRKSDINSTDNLYNNSLEIEWEKYLNLEFTFAITENVSDCTWIKNSHFASLRLKDAIVERIKSHNNGKRPDVDKKTPDIVFHLSVNKNLVSWYVDFAGRNLSHRCYRSLQTEAVLSEHLASSILLRTSWKNIALEKNTVILDPFCGSGTLCIEAALIATNTAPGLVNPDKYAFYKLPFHDSTLWKKTVEEAEEQQIVSKCSITGFDIDENAVKIAKKNAKNAGFTDIINFEIQDFSKITEDQIAELSKKGEPYLITDPPYGIRLSEIQALKVWKEIGQKAFDLFAGWKMSFICPDSELFGYLQMKPERTNVLMNGGIECQLAHYYVFSNEERKALADKVVARKIERLNTPLSQGAQSAANRLKKNMETIGREMDSKNVSCYRLYDADMPEYNAAIDFYEGRWISLQEYAPPSSVDTISAEKRLEDLILATERVTGVNYENIFVKRREIKKGNEQYKKHSNPADSHFFVIREHCHRFVANFQDYLDTGIFLDHRPVRILIEQMSKNTRFLNLYCYTATATVYAASGGALSTVSVDTSTTYLDWAQRNMKLNGFSTINHFFYKSDCITYLKSNRDVFDLIFCDPPTYSNSKDRLPFDVQKDHAYLIRLCMRHLSSDGTLIFSTNFTRFRLYEQLTEEFEIEDISLQTIDIDFSRNKKIHKCFLIRHKINEKTDNTTVIKKNILKNNKQIATINDRKKRFSYKKKSM